MRNFQGKLDAMKQELDQMRETIRIVVRQEKFALMDLTAITASIIISLAPAIHEVWRSIIAGIGHTTV